VLENAGPERGDSRHLLEEFYLAFHQRRRYAVVSIEPPVAVSFFSKRVIASGVSFCKPNLTEILSGSRDEGLQSKSLAISREKSRLEKHPADILVWILGSNLLFSCHSEL
jgi:hypothetical protein